MNNVQNPLALKEILQLYFLSSGQKINFRFQQYFFFISAVLGIISIIEHLANICFVTSRTELEMRERACGINLCVY